MHAGTLTYASTTRHTHSQYQANPPLMSLYVLAVITVNFSIQNLIIMLQTALHLKPYN